MTLRPLLLAFAATAVLALPLGIATPADAQTKLKMVLNWKYQGPQGLVLHRPRTSGYFKAEGLEVDDRPGQRLGFALARVVASGAYDVGFGDINALIDLAGQEARRRADRLSM